MKCVECPHCGQMQMLDDSGKCIKCGKEISSYGSTGKNIRSKIYICPKCGHHQIDKSDYCEKCKANMVCNAPVSSVMSFAFGLGAFLSVLFLVVSTLSLQQDSWSREADIKNSIISAICTAIFIALSAKCFRFSRRNAAPIEKHMQTKFEFTNSEGIQDAKFDMPGHMEFDLGNEQIIFSFGPNLRRTLSFTQVLGVSWGNYNYQEAKQFVGGVSVGNVFIHESPISRKQSPFMGIKYRPSQGGKWDNEIKIIFSPLIDLKNLHEIIAWIGFELDPTYIVPKDKQL